MPDPITDPELTPGIDPQPDIDPRPDVASEPDPDAPSGRRHPVRMATVVLGLVLAVVAVTVWSVGVLELDVSLGAVATAAMIGAGLLLLAGALFRPQNRRI